MNLLPKLFGLSTEMTKEHYHDVDIGSTIDNDNDIRNTIMVKQNNTKIAITIKDTPKVKIITLTRGKIFRKQSLTFKVLQDHGEYLQGLLELEVIFKTFLDKFEKEERIYSDFGYEVFVSTFQTRALDTLPENMYHIHSIFTKNVPMWLRFKRLFAVIEVFVDPLVISTLKWKMFQYLQQQRRTVYCIKDGEDESLVAMLSPNETNKIFDLFVFLQYGYLFFLFKHINMNGGIYSPPIDTEELLE